MSVTPYQQRPHIRGILIDISGTLHIGSTLTPSAVAALQKLRDSSIPFRLCSNSSKESSESLIIRLRSLGFKCLDPIIRNVRDGLHKDRQTRLIWTSINAAAQLVKDLGLRRPYMLLSDSARQEVSVNTEESQLKELHYDSVVIGLAPSLFDYDHLNTAFRILKGEHRSKEQPSGQQVPLIATHKAKYVQTEDGLSLGPGPFVTALENATGITAHVVGKPTETFFQMVINDFSDEEVGHLDRRGSEYNPQSSGFDQGKGRIAVIGDDIEADLGGGALTLGLWRVLVRTGKYRAGDENRPGIVPPDEIFDTFADFVESLSTKTCEN